MNLSKLVLAIFCVLLVSCGDKEEPPELPPTLSFVLNFDEFPEKNKTKPLTEKLEPLMAPAGANFVHAVFNVGIWKLITDVGMLIPATSFIAVFNAEPEKNANGNWQWSNQLSQFFTSYVATLVRSLDGSDVVWRMYISKANDYDDFLWYSGRHNKDMSAGTWTLKKDYTNNYDFIGIEWTHDSATSTGTLKYSNIIPADSGDMQASENGGYIYYGTTIDSTYDAFFDIYNKGADNLTSIQWNRVSVFGRVSDMDKFGDAHWHCWDEGQQDTVCSP